VKLEKKLNQEREANATWQKLHWCRWVGWLDYGGTEINKMCVCERERKKEREREREREVVVILLEWRRKKMGRGEYYRVLIYF
jgi:hypothetical protein